MRRERVLEQEFDAITQWKLEGAIDGMTTWHRTRGQVEAHPWVHTPPLMAESEVSVINLQHRESQVESRVGS